MRSLVIRERRGLLHYSALPSVAGSGRQVSCFPTLSLEAGDEWDCHSQGQLAAHCHFSLLSLPPGASSVWLACQQRCANVLQQKRAVESKPLSHFHVPGEHDEVPGEQGSKPL